MALHSEYGKAGDQVFCYADVTSADFSCIEQLQVTVALRNGQTFECRDIDALEIAMALKPSVLESRRLQWPKFAWAVHNLVGHPVMQVLAFFRVYRLAFWVHDQTVPRPLGAKTESALAAKSSDGVVAFQTNNKTLRR